MEEYKSQFNIGIAILKIWMCFEVILMHFWNASNVKGILYIIAQLRLAAVPVFMMTSFYYLYPLLCNITKERVQKRILRIAWPQVGWTLIAGLLLYRRPISDLYLQLIFGHSINRTMWFQFVLIILTVFFIGFFKLCKNLDTNYLLFGLIIISFTLQFSGFNYKIISPLRDFCGDDTLSAPLGRVVESIPWAVIGILFNKYGVVEKVKDKKIFAVILFLISFIPIVLNKFIMPKGFGYSGLGLCMVGAAFVLFFSSVVDEIIPEKVGRFIEILAKPTMGIYCCQDLIAGIIEPDMGYQSQDMGFCFMLFWGCWILCMLLSKVPVRWVRHLVV